MNGCLLLTSTNRFIVLDVAQPIYYYNIIFLFLCYKWTSEIKKD